MVKRCYQGKIGGQSDHKDCPGSHTRLEPRQPMRTFWLATGLVALLALVFSLYFIYYLMAKQDALMTNAEDLGIMDQALWNTLHGQMLHQTICNSISDTNCFGPEGVSRFALHFEPLLLPISLLYLLWPNPKTLQVLQVLVVASGAFPAFWLARLRLRNEWIGVLFALLYLLYPAQQNALIFDFHAVTLTAALLLFTLYFLYARKTVLLFIFALLSMACKEEIPLMIALVGLWSLLLQRRLRTGAALFLLATAWIVMSLLVMHLFSPTGSPLLLSRYAYLGSNPMQMAQTLVLHPLFILKQHVIEHRHLSYLNMLLAPSGYLPLLAPWALILALPALALNLLSADAGMYSGQFQYNAELVPILIFSTIEAIVVIKWVVQRFMAQVYIPVGKSHLQKTLRRSGYVSLLLFAVLIYALCSVVDADFGQSGMPFAQGFRWPHVTAHSTLGLHFIDSIPPTASVSAQTRLVPHLSQRVIVYLFPYGDTVAQYILLDVTGDKYPFATTQAYNREVKKVLLSGQYGIVTAQDGYLLLKRDRSPSFRGNGLRRGDGLSSPAHVGTSRRPDEISFCLFSKWHSFN